MVIDDLDRKIFIYLSVTTSAYQPVGVHAVKHSESERSRFFELIILIPPTTLTPRCAIGICADVCFDTANYDG